MFRAGGRGLNPAKIEKWYELIWGLRRTNGVDRCELCLLLIYAIAFVIEKSYYRNNQPVAYLSWSPIPFPRSLIPFQRGDPVAVSRNMTHVPRLSLLTLVTSYGPLVTLGAPWRLSETLGGQRWPQWPAGSVRRMTLSDGGRADIGTGILPRPTCSVIRASGVPRKNGPHPTRRRQKRNIPAPLADRRPAKIKQLPRSVIGVWGGINVSITWLLEFYFA